MAIAGYTGSRASGQTAAQDGCEVPVAREGACLQPGAAVASVKLGPQWQKEAQHQFVC